MMPEPSIERLRQLLSYDEETGKLFWLDSPNRRIRKGSEAGCRAPNGYIVVRIDGRLCRAHRIAFALMHGRYPKDVIDHINRDPSDNRAVNLRECSHAENLRNTSLRSDNTSGMAGVHYYRREKRWGAYIHCNGTSISLGRFHTRKEAIKARSAAAREAYGEFYPGGSNVPGA